MKIIRTFIFILVVIMTELNAKADNPAVDIVSPREFQKELTGDTNSYLLDVRTPEEFNSGHLKGAHLLDWLNQNNFKQMADTLDKSKTIFIYCRSGRRSNEAAHYLADRGYKVIDMDGGILAWEADSLPIVKTND